MHRFLLALLLFSPLVGNANSDAIDIRNSYEDIMNSYRTGSSRELKCLSFCTARGYAQSLMKYHKDASLARRWNAMLPRTGCKQAPLIIDPAAINVSKYPEVNQPNDGFLAAEGTAIEGSCLPFHKILALEWTRSIKAKCPDGGYISITAH